MLQARTPDGLREDPTILWNLRTRPGVGSREKRAAPLQCGVKPASGTRFTKPDPLRFSAAAITEKIDAGIDRSSTRST